MKKLTFAFVLMLSCTALAETGEIKFVAKNSEGFLDYGYVQPSNLRKKMVFIGLVALSQSGLSAADIQEGDLACFEVKMDRFTKRPTVTPQTLRLAKFDDSCAAEFQD